MPERYPAEVRAPDFPPGLDWMNTPAPLTLKALSGKVVLLDFWTSCCINCQHILPQLRRLEERFAAELVVVGVHAGKFPAEGETFNIQQAVMRHDIRHPVVNDRDFMLWRAYATRAWPTVVLVSPEGRVIGRHSGEFDADALAGLIAEIIAEYDAQGKIDRTPLPVALERHKHVDSLLSFPGGILADIPRSRLFIADTEHHRILHFGLKDGRLRVAHGSGEPGFLDGPSGHARFRSPHGLALWEDTLYVADTENHAIRRIDLHAGSVTTVAGTGQQAQPWPQEGPARGAVLNSPWDLALVNEDLYVAMAGSHQLWRIDLGANELHPFAGDGREALMDGPRREARLAQPSGIASDGRQLWFVDSETSSLRTVPLPSVSLEGGVRTHLGLGLFEFGDVDGARPEARLQHPLGVRVSGGRVYLADSYNHKIKVYEPETRLVRTLSGSGEPGIYDGEAREAAFWEPGALAVVGDLLYVMDTNNHALRVVQRDTGEVRTLQLRD